MADFDDPRVTSLGLFIEVGAALERRIDAVARNHGLVEADVGNLLRLARSKGGRLLVRDLVVQTGLSAQDVAGMAAGLERRGLVKLDHGAHTGDIVCSLTVEGGITLAAVLDDLLDEMDPILAALGEDRPTIEAAVRRFRDKLHPTATAGGT